eukprot:CAMPEP_0201694530 /NCGR_PEP_ID=MMETSP0578-20130828/6760_1 /ASSEMBLY_ACC=CAM_ASM_000663 /TAXON_ID=267565 /ORGANISM="Skeletonema grethea, Strain CCMP 1804" /LENGTH=597 /DNA_ID=CAMNT_0048180217 /DNA_START=199 /DNA_END=1992 /DNA_ORIENTATION=-
MYGKKLDSNDPNHHSSNTHTKTSREPPPNHEFSYRWFRGPTVEPCAYEGCPRRTSFSPHDWSKHALGGSGCSLQCVSAQSSLYKATFCNSDCFVKAWKTQYTIQSSGSNSDGSGNHGIPQARSSTPLRKRTGSYCDDDRSVGSQSTSGNDGNYIPATPGDSNSNNSSTTTMNNPYSAQLSNEDTEWIEISRDQLYIPHTDDIGRKLKVEASAYSVDTGELLMHRVVKTDLVLSRTPEPEKRNLVTAKPAGGGGARFRIVTYNILAEIYATQQQYPYADLWALSWDFRFQNIIREVVDVGPDIVCLQEVQADHYESHLYNAMHEAGFEGVYKQKTRQAMGMTGKVDGCALFWRRTKFHLVESYSIEFNELAQRQVTQGMGLNPRSEEGASILNKLSKDNVAQLVVLETAQPSMSRGNREPNQVCIANTHLYSNKDCPDVKLWQTLHLLQELETFIMARGPANLPLMICGDFNSTPDSAVYDLLSRQLVHPGHPDVNTGDENGPSVLPDIMSITHSHMLGSVYNTVLGEEPKFTNYTMQFKGVLDYMWYSTRNLRPLSAAPIPDESVLTRHGDALPSTQYSSDHLMQISDMQIVSGGSR